MREGRWADEDASDINLNDVVVADPDIVGSEALSPCHHGESAGPPRFPSFVSRRRSRGIFHRFGIGQNLETRVCQRRGRGRSGRAYSGGDYANQVRDRFLAEYEAARTLPIPDGYDFRIDGKPTPPNLMQRHVAVQVRDRKRVGNWSGTGAGKTLSAILASRVATPN